MPIFGLLKLYVNIHNKNIDFIIHHVFLPHFLKAISFENLCNSNLIQQALGSYHSIILFIPLLTKYIVFNLLVDVFKGNFTCRLSTMRCYFLRSNLRRMGSWLPKDLL